MCRCVSQLDWTDREDELKVALQDGLPCQHQRQRAVQSFTVAVRSGLHGASPRCTHALPYGRPYACPQHVQRRGRTQGTQGYDPSSFQVVIWRPFCLNNYNNYRVWVREEGVVDLAVQQHTLPALACINAVG